jgi:transposase-like protein
LTQGFGFGILRHADYLPFGFWGLPESAISLSLRTKGFGNNLFRASSVVCSRAFFLRLGIGESLMKSDMDIGKLMVDYDTEQECRVFLEELRWPDGITCPRCGGKIISRIKARDQFDCDSCRYQFSVMSGTIFHDSHLPLPKWFIATFLICEARKGMSANQMKRILGVSYKTAWYLCHRIRAAMKETNQPMLEGTVEMDETWVGGRERKGRGWNRPDNNKEVVIGIRQRGGELRFFHASDAKSGTLAKYIKENVSTDVDVIVTDEYPAYVPAMIASGIKGSQHETIKHRDRVYVRGDVHTNTVESAFSLLKRGIIGSWHKISAKHLQAYLDEMTWRFDNRKNPYLFRDTILRLISSPNIEYKQLTAVV